MAGEPARALVTDQITSSSAIPDEDDSRRAMAVTAAVAAAIPAAIEGVLNGAVRRNELSLVVKHRLQLGTLVIHINLVSLCFWNVMWPLFEEFHCNQKVFGKPRLRTFFEGM